VAKVGRPVEADGTGEGDAGVTDGGALADGDVEGAGATEGFGVAVGDVVGETGLAGPADGSESVAIGGVVTVGSGVPICAVVQPSSIRTGASARNVPSRIERSYVANISTRGVKWLISRNP
jgi:hypothetical protein